MMRTLLALTMVLATVTAAKAGEGGVKDSTGLVWSQSQLVETGSSWSWAYANTNAANYSVSDLDASGNLTLYDDWRLPTVPELQAAILDGTMTGLMPIASYTSPDGTVTYAPYYYSLGIWSSQTKGNKAWQVEVVRDTVYPWTLIIASSGSAKLEAKINSTEVFFVRGKRR